MSSQAAVGTVNKDFLALIDKVSNVVHKISGNRLGEKQAYMVETRVKKRMMELGIKTAEEYIKYIDQNLDHESYILVGLITTHHTFFFREFPHFEILKNRLPELLAAVKKRGDKTLYVWSAACSRGHEVYSLAMFLDFNIPQIDPSMSFKILGTDIDGESVKIASNGVYHQNEIKEIPMNYLSTHWAKGTGDIAMYAKVKTQLKSKCEFKPGNLLKVSEAVKDQKFDVIFCRNVFIYFETSQIEMISKDLMARLQPHGVYFSGISEPLSGMKLDLHSIGPSAYIHKAAAPVVVKPQAVSNVIPLKGAAPVAVPAPVTYQPQILKVLCVDDSPSILTLLKKVLTAEHGFEVIGTAINGKDAMEKMKTLKPDLMTLDIHMPEMDGVTYLEKNHTKNHPPVMIISSASRADSDTAMRAFKFGASDYVEKPALTNLEERGEEIRTKLKSIAGSVARATVVSSFDKENQKTFSITSPEKKMRIMLGSLSDLGAFKGFINELDNSQPPTMIFFEGQGEILEGIVKEHQRDFKKDVILFESMDTKLEPNKIYFVDFKKFFGMIHKKYATYPTSIMAYGVTSAHAAKQVIDWKGVELLVEDLGEKGNAKHPLKAYASDVVPATSFAYMSCRYLSTK
ncbi:MAG: response regulator [Bdellovibrionales bacterium]|nr:response regulator [Bdellovibrionales bacterium]